MRAPNPAFQHIMSDDVFKKPQKFGRIDFKRRKNDML
jgi:hypothetical protein